MEKKTGHMEPDTTTAVKKTQRRKKNKEKKDRTKSGGSFKPSFK
jgi:hypothetical protein